MILVKKQANLIQPLGPILTPPGQNAQLRGGMRARMRAKVRCRAKARIQRMNNIALNPPVMPARTKKREFKKAMAGTGGIKSLIAENLGVARSTVTTLLDRPDWADVLALYMEEVEAGKDEAETCIRDAIKQRGDLSTASLNARWLLSRVRRQKYGDESTVKVEGGKTPVRLDVLSANIPVESLNLPLELKRQIIEAMDAKEDGDRAMELSGEAVQPVIVEELEDEPTVDGIDSV